MGDELSALPPTGSSAPEFVTTPPTKGESASARHIDASVLENERDNLYSMRSRIGTMRKCLFKVPPVDQSRHPSSGSDPPTASNVTAKFRTSKSRTSRSQI